MPATNPASTKNASSTLTNIFKDKPDRNELSNSPDILGTKPKIEVIRNNPKMNASRDFATLQNTPKLTSENLAQAQLKAMMHIKNVKKFGFGTPAENINNQSSAGDASRKTDLRDHLQGQDRKVNGSQRMNRP